MTGANLGVCGAFLPTGRCRGRVIAYAELEGLIEGECDQCGAAAAVPSHKASPGIAHQRRIDRADLPKRFFGKPFEETPENVTALTSVREWISGYPEHKLPAPALWGRAGRGKSHLLSAVSMRLIREREASVLYRSTRGLLRELQDFDGDAERAWERAVTVAVLVLDDLGAERGTEWRGDQLADLIDARYEAMLPILLATNYAPSTWGDVMDERTVSRLRGMTFAVELQGADRRTTEPIDGRAAHA